MCHAELHVTIGMHCAPLLYLLCLQSQSFIITIAIIVKLISHSNYCSMVARLLYIQVNSRWFLLLSTWPRIASHLLCVRKYSTGFWLSDFPSHASLSSPSLCQVVLPLHPAPMFRQRREQSPSRLWPEYRWRCLTRTAPDGPSRSYLTYHSISK